MALASSAGCTIASQQHSVRSPLIPDIEISALRRLTIRCYGDTADVEAAAWAEALLEGDREGLHGCSSRRRLRRCRSRTARKASIDTGSKIRAHFRCPGTGGRQAE